MDGFARNMPIFVRASVDLTDTKDDYEYHSSAMAEGQRELFETDIGEYHWRVGRETRPRARRPAFRHDESWSQAPALQTSSIRR